MRFGGKVIVSTGVFNAKLGGYNLLYKFEDFVAGIVGVHAGKLLGEPTLALEFYASVEDIALTIHAHPNLHETAGLAAELAGGTITDSPNPAAAKR
jgi:hypothetical protein